MGECGLKGESKTQKGNDWKLVDSQPSEPRQSNERYEFSRPAFAQCSSKFRCKQIHTDHIHFLSFMSITFYLMKQQLSQPWTVVPNRYFLSWAHLKWLQSLLEPNVSSTHIKPSALGLKLV